MDKRVAVLLIIIFLSACSNTGQPKRNNTTIIKKGGTTTIVFGEGELSAQKKALGNESVSDMNLILARLQGVPVLPLGMKKKTVAWRLRKNKCRTIKVTDDAIWVKGPRELYMGGMVIENKPSDIFIYEFENEVLVSGPQEYIDTENKN